MKQFLSKLFLPILLILTINIYAKNNWFIKAGANYSTLNDNVVETEDKFGYSIGIEKDWQIAPVFYFTSGIHYNTRNGIIKNITVGYGDPSSRVFKEDIHLYLHYISVPLFLKYTQHINEKLSFNIFFGPSLNAMKKDNSKKKNLSVIYDPDNFPNGYVHPDYYFADDFYKSNSGTTMDIGIGIEYSRFIMDYFYSNGLSINQIKSVILDQYLRTQVIRIGVKI